MVTRTLHCVYCRSEALVCNGWAPMANKRISAARVATNLYGVDLSGTNLLISALVSKPSSFAMPFWQGAVAVEL